MKCGQELQGSSVGRAVAAPRMLVFTAFGTMLYVDTTSGELRHGPIDSSPPNVILLREETHARIMYDTFECFGPIVCLPDRSMLAESVDGSHEVGQPTLFEVISLDQRWFGFRAGDLFLSSEPDGRVVLARQHFYLWETFRVSDNPSGENGEPKTPCGAPSEPFVQNGELIRSGGAAARKCTLCSYIFYDPVPSPDFLDIFYREAYPAQNWHWYNPETDYSEARQGPVVDGILTAIHRFRPDFREGGKPFVVHDIGCSFGGLVMHLRRMGIDAAGTELNSAAVTAGRARGNQKIFNLTVGDYIARIGVTPDLFTAIHVIEHMPDPLAFLEGLFPLFGEDTIALFRFPNGRYIPALKTSYLRYWWGCGYPAHLHLFGPHSVLCLLERAGFACLDLACTRREEQPDLLASACGLGDRTFDIESLITANIDNFGAMELQVVFARMDGRVTRNHYHTLTRINQLRAALEKAGA